VEQAISSRRDSVAVQSGPDTRKSSVGTWSGGLVPAKKAADERQPGSEPGIRGRAGCEIQEIVISRKVRSGEDELTWPHSEECFTRPPLYRLPGRSQHRQSHQRTRRILQPPQNAVPTAPWSQPRSSWRLRSLVSASLSKMMSQNQHLLAIMPIVNRSSDPPAFE